ncbi:MAG: hypothetical protein AB7O43_20610 [Hyphomicrobiaceae bacterium]
MILVIFVLLVLTILAAAFVMAPLIREERIVFDMTPDAPAPFGEGMAWLAVKTRDAARVADVLNLTPLQQANWQTGIGTIYDERLGESHVYLAPPVDGWTFVVGLALPQPLGRSFVDKCTPMLLDLSAAFPEAQYFLAYPPLDCYGWARVNGGKLVRAFAVNDAGVIWNKGRAGKPERALGLQRVEIKFGRGSKSNVNPPVLIYPTEAHVLHIASCWSIDPTSIAAKQPEAELGYICAPPPQWRPERLRRTG